MTEFIWGRHVIQRVVVCQQVMSRTQQNTAVICYPQFWQQKHTRRSPVVFHKCQVFAVFVSELSQLSEFSQLSKAFSDRLRVIWISHIWWRLCYLSNRRQYFYWRLFWMSGFSTAVIVHKPVSILLAFCYHFIDSWQFVNKIVNTLLAVGSLSTILLTICWHFVSTLLAVSVHWN